MPYKEVWVDEAELDEFSDDELVYELERRGYIVMRKGISDDMLFKIRQAYVIDTPDEFRNFIEKFLAEHGYHV